MTIKFAGIEKEIEKKVSQAELELIKEYERLFLSTKARLESIYFSAGENATPQILKRYARLMDLSEQIRSELKRIAGISVDKIEQLLPDVYEENYLKTGWTFEKTTGFEMGFRNLSSGVIQRSINNPFLTTKWQTLSINNHLKSSKDIINVINEGFANGWSYTKSAKALEENIYGTGKRNIKGIAYKTNRIIRTESHRVTNLSRNDAIENAINAGKRLGFTVYKVWDAKNTGDPRDNHSSMDGNKANEDGEFLLITQSGSQILVFAPGNTGVASEDINCGCFMRAELEGLEQRGNEVDAQLSFENWGDQ